MPICMDKIEAFLRDVEGKQQLVGYIPCYIIGRTKNSGQPLTQNYTGVEDPSLYDPMGVSGVTIATGVDLGQTDKATLKKLGLDEVILEKLSPYLGKSGREACFVLHAQPLTVSQSDADAIDLAMHMHHLAMIKAKFDKDAGRDGAFESMPWQGQVVVFSLLYQRGVSSPRHYPETWGKLLAGDFSGAALDFFDDDKWNGYMSRRNKEGRLLQNVELLA